MSGAPGLNISPYALDPSYLPTVCDSVMVGKCVCVGGRLLMMRVTSQCMILNYQELSPITLLLIGTFLHVVLVVFLGPFCILL